MSERAIRTHVVPGNIMSVEFKLFDFMTLKQFLYLVVSSFLSYVLFTFLPDSIFKWLIPFIITTFGIIVAFVKFNGEPFEVYTTNFLLGIIEPQRRVWSKTPIVKKTTTLTEDTAETAARKAMNTLAENFVPTEEIIPINYNSAVTSVDMEEQKFLKTFSLDKSSGTRSIPAPVTDLSKLNFDEAFDQKSQSNTMDTPSSSGMISTANNVPQKDLNINNNSMFPNTNSPSGLNTSDQNSFTINMDDDKNDTPTFVPLAQDVPQSERAESIPDINIDFSNAAPTTSQEPAPMVIDLPTIENNPYINPTQNSPIMIDESSVAATPVAPVASTMPTVPEPAHIITPPMPSVSHNTENGEAPISQRDVIGKIHGKIISVDYKSFPGVALVMYDEKGNAVDSTVSDTHGEFAFNAMPETFEISIVAKNNKKFLFSPMDKNTHEVLIHELQDDGSNSGVPSIFKHNGSDLNQINALDDATEMVNTSDAQIANTINGVVKDDKGHYIAGVLISVKDMKNTTIRALATNPLGQFFSHSPLNNGDYTVQFEKEGYSFSSYTVTLDGRIINPKIFICKNTNLQSI